MAESLVQKAISKEAETMNAGEQNVRYTMKFNSATGQWEQNEILTPLVKTTYPGIRTPDGGVKDISKGLAGAPYVEETEIAPIAPMPVIEGTEPEPVTPIMKQPDTQRDSFEEAQKAYGVTSGGIRYEPQQTPPSEATADDMKFNVMGGGFNSRSNAQNLLYSQEKGILNDLVNPQVKTEEEAKKDAQKQSALSGLLGPMKTIGGIAKFLNPRSEKAQIETLLNNNIIQVRDNNGNLLTKENALKFLTEDDKGKLNIKKGNELIESGYKVEQLDKLAKDFQNSAAFVNLESEKANNFVTATGAQLTNLNPVMGTSGTTLFGLFDESKGASHTNGEQVLVVDSGPGHDGGAYNSEGKFIGMNGQVYAFGTADQAMQSANGGLIPAEVLERMTDKNGKLKDLYLEGGAFAIDSNMVDDNGFYIGDVVLENRDIVDDGGNGDVVGNTAPDGSNDNNNYQNQQNQIQDDIADDVSDTLEDIYGSDPEPPEQTYEDTYGPVEDEQGFGGGGDNSGSGSSSGSSSDSKDKKIVCTEMYRQTELNDWKMAMKIWGFHTKTHLTKYHQKGYHFIFMPWVKGMRKNNVLTTLGGWLAQRRTQHLKYVLSRDIPNKSKKLGIKNNEKDDVIGRIWCSFWHPITFIVGKVLTILRIKDL